MGKNYVLLLIFTSFATLTFAQTVRLSGKVINSKNEAVPSATIAVEGLGKALAADVEGRFSILLETGKKYTITVSSSGYNSKTLEEVEVKANEDNTITITLEDKTTLEQVVVRTSVRKETTSALINFQKNNTSVSSGLAADFIRRTPDKNTGEVLKRVSGTSIQDNKFVIVRGLGDRYNTAFLNGAQLPSSEPDKKAFSFDVIPAHIVDNIVINKTATPDLTGEFAGGLVQVTTKDVPTKNFLNLGVQFGFNTVSTFNDFFSNERGKKDWIGFDDGRRKLPTGFPGSRQEYNALINQPNGEQLQLDATKLFRNDVYTEKKSTAAPLQTYSLSLGTVKRYKNGGSFGTVASVLYRKQMFTYEVDRGLYEQDGTKVLDFNDEQNKYAVNVGAMLNFAYVKGRHKISFKNLFNQFFEDNYYTRTGSNIERGGDIALKSSVLNQRTFYTGIFEGNHQLTDKGWKVYWNAAYSFNEKKQPDLRTSAYFRSGIGSQNPLEWDQDDTRRFDSKLQDHGFSGNIALTIPFDAFGEKQSFKVGGSGILRFRDFRSRIFRYVETSDADFNNSYRYLPYDKIFDDANISVNGFVMDEFTNNEDKYFAISSQNSGYLMLDNKFSEKWRVIWGARLEFFEQFLETKDRSAKRIVINPEQYKVLPSLNIAYSINTKNIVRLSGAMTVSRPEFREIAPFQFFDYEANFGVAGNLDLKTADIYNFDVRYEIYPGAGEAITIGGFYKRFINPIEFRLDPGSVATRRNYFYQNAKDANTYGIELEVRKNLKFLGGESDILSDFSLFANFTYIFSEVKFNDELLGKVVSADRPVQGQSPYLINGGLQYSNNESGWSSSLLYNRVGSRLTLVGYNSLGFYDVYENPRDILDFQISKRILKKRGELRLSFSDVLGQRYTFYENVDGKRSYNPDVDRVFNSYKPGSTIQIGFIYDFDL